MGRKETVFRMNYEFRRLEIGRKSDGRSISVMAPRQTLDFYGWSDAFEVWTPRKLDLGNGRVGFRITKPAAMNGNAGGKRFRISRSPRVDRNVAGMTNVFRLTSNYRRIDLINLLQSTQVDWHWVSDPVGKKWFREELVQDRLIGLTQ